MNVRCRVIPVAEQDPLIEPEARNRSKRRMRLSRSHISPGAQAAALQIGDVPDSSVGRDATATGASVLFQQAAEATSAFWHCRGSTELVGDSVLAATVHRPADASSSPG